MESILFSRNERKRQPIGMLDQSSQSWLPTQALALLAFFVYATHASHVACVACIWMETGLQSAWVRCSTPSVCLSVCAQRNSKTNDSKLGIGNDLGIFWKWYGFGVERSNVKVTGSINAFSNQWLLRLHNGLTTAIIRSSSNFMKSF